MASTRKLNLYIETPDHLAQSLADLAQLRVLASVSPGSALTEKEAAFILTAIAARSPKDFESDGWASALSDTLSGPDKEFAGGELCTWALRFVSKWRQSIAPRRGPGELTNDIGKFSLKALTRMTRAGLADDESVWLSFSSIPSSRSLMAFQWGDRALFNAVIERFGGFDALWAKKDAAGQPREAIEVGYALSGSFRSKEFAEWAASAQKWLSQPENRQFSDLSEIPGLSVKRLWIGPLRNLRPQHARDKADSAQNLLKILVAHGGWLKKEEDRAQLLRGFVQEGNPEGVKLALEFGFSPNDRQPNAHPALFEALAECGAGSRPGAAEIVHLLLDAGADTAAQNADGLDALTFAQVKIPKDLRDPHPGSFFSHLVGASQAKRDQEHLRAEVASARAREEEELARKALALIRQGALFDASGAPVGLAELRALPAAALASQSPAAPIDGQPDAASPRRRRL